MLEEQDAAVERVEVGAARVVDLLAEGLGGVEGAANVTPFPMPAYQPPGGDKSST